MTTVLIGDSQSLFSQALGMALMRRRGFDVLPQRPQFGYEAVQLGLGLKPDVIVLDYWMPDMGGAAVAATVRRRAKNTEVLLLAWFHGGTELLNSLAAGAAGFLPKSLRVDDVASAIHRIAGGETPVYPADMERLIDKERLQEATEAWGRIKTLTRREHQILQLIGAGQSSGDIAALLGMRLSTARTHISRILNKLEARTQMEAVGIARRYELIHP